MSEPYNKINQIKYNLIVIIILFCFAISACQAMDNTDNSVYLTTAKTKDFKLELINLQGQCAIKFNHSTKSLNIPYPCGFVRSRKNRPAQTYSYSGVGQVFIIAGPIVNDSEYANNTSVKPKHKCSNKGQAIILQGNKLLMRKKHDIPLGYCHQLGFDEKDYYGFAYPVN